MCAVDTAQLTAVKSNERDRLPYFTTMVPPLTGPKFEPVIVTGSPPRVPIVGADTAEIDGGVYDTVVDGSDVVLLD